MGISGICDRMKENQKNRQKSRSGLTFTAPETAGEEETTWLVLFGIGIWGMRRKNDKTVKIRLFMGSFFRRFILIRCTFCEFL